MEQSELLHFVVEALETIGLRYFVIGSMAILSVCLATASAIIGSISM